MLGQEERAKKKGNEKKNCKKKVPTSAIVDTTFQPLQVVAVVVFCCCSSSSTLSHTPLDFTKGKTGSALPWCSLSLSGGQTRYHSSVLTSAPGAAARLQLLLSSTSGEEHLQNKQQLCLDRPPLFVEEVNKKTKKLKTSSK